MRKALYFTAPHTVELREEPIPEPQAGEVLIKTTQSAISPGTEMLIYQGEAPTALAADSTLAALGGSLAYPLKYGYACVGTVIACGPDVNHGAWQGRTVFAFNPHETHFTAATADLHPIPQGVSSDAALFFPNMETALNLVHDGHPLYDERVAVFGQGVVGLLTVALLARMPLEALIAVDRHPLRLEHAARLGATHTLTPAEFAERTDLHAACDLAYEVSGAPAALNTAIQATGFGGRVVIGSWYGAKPVSVDLGGYFHRSRIRLISSQVSTLDPTLSGRWSKQRRFDAVWRHLAAHPPDELITSRMPFPEQAPAAYARLANAPHKDVQILLAYGDNI